MKLDAKYDRFIGQKVLVNFTITEYRGRKSKSYHISDEDMVISLIKSEATLDKLTCRIWLPNTMGTMDAVSNRLNIHVDEQTDGSFEVTKLNIG
jgi:hypothetical protein